MGKESQEELDVLQDQGGQNYIEVTCGDATGELFLEKLRRMPNGKALEKCILCNNLLYTPQEFENLGGKKAKAWKKSIKHKGKPLQKLFTSRALQEQEGSMIEQTHQQQGGTSLDLPRQNLIDIDGIFDELESKLSKTIEEVVRSTMSALKSSIENEIKRLTQKVDNLTARVVKLENAQHSLTERSSEQLVVTQSLSPELASQAIQTQIKQIEDSVSNHQRLWEKKERESRKNNMVVIGLEENVDTEENENTLDLINEFLESKLKITSIKAVQARRLGRRKQLESKLRPILTIFLSLNDKRTVIAKRTSLAGTKVFLKDDLTKEQLQVERQLQETRKKLLQHPDFRGKKITVYRNKIWVNHSPITSDMIRTAGISQ